MEENISPENQVQAPPNEDCYEGNFKNFSAENFIGVNSDKRQNFLFIDEETFVYYSGLIFGVSSIATKTNKIFPSIDGGGIGAIAVHTEKQIVAVGEKGRNPNIYIYSHPIYEIIATLSGGTERGYSSISFSKNSDKLISVGNYPDYAIVVWNWKTEQILLRAKAFSQEIYKVCFSDYSDDVICTAGMAHIKFWKIANTFTGLKLKGEIGKFGGIELSDIYDMAVLNDGNVVSGSEKGFLFVWEGNFIKNVVRINENKPCHSGNIDVIKLLNKNLLITGSSGDCFIKFWSVEELKSLESIDSIYCNLSPLKEIDLGEGVGVIGIDAEFFLKKGLLFIQNRYGSILRVQLQITQEFNSSDAETLKKFQQAEYSIAVVNEHVYGHINSVALHDNKIVFGGDDGRLKIVDADSHEYTQHIVGKEAIAAIAVDSQNGLIFVGNSKGLLKQYRLPSFELVSTTKIFETAFQTIKLEENYLICKSTNQIFVLFNEPPKALTPFFLFDHPSSAIINVIYDKGRIIFGTSAGEVKAFKIPDRASFNNDRNYQITFFEEKYSAKLHMMEFQKPKRDEEDIRFYINDDVKFVDVEWESQPIRSLALFKTEVTKKSQQNSLRVIVGSESEFTGYLYLLELAQDFTSWYEDMSVDAEELRASNYSEDESRIQDQSNLIQVPAENNMMIIRPSQAFKTRAKIVSEIHYDGESYCILGYVDGVVSVRQAFNIDNEIFKIRAHCHDLGEVFFAITNGSNRLITAAKDSTLAILTFNDDGSAAAENQKPSFVSRLLIDWTQNPIQPSSQEELISQGYSLQQEKIQSLKDRQKAHGLEIKSRIHHKLAIIRKEFKLLRNANMCLEKELQMPEDQLEFNQEQTQSLINQYQYAIDETSREVAYEVEYSKAKLEKLKNFFVAENDSLVFSVFKLQKRESVESFRLKNLPDFLKKEIQKISRQYSLVSHAEMPSRRGNNDAPLIANTQNLLEILKEIRKKITESKNIDHYHQLKSKVKTECAEHDNIDKLRELRATVSQKIAEVKNEAESVKNLDHKKETLMAKNAFGDYKLKCLPGFTINEKDRISVEKYEAQIFLFEQFIHERLRNFNTDLDSFRKRKLTLLDKIEQTSATIQEINRQLGIEHTNIDVIYIALLEDPEQRIKVTQEELESFIASNDDVELKRRIGIAEMLDHKIKLEDHRKQGFLAHGDAIVHEHPILSRANIGSMMLDDKNSQNGGYENGNGFRGLVPSRFALPENTRGSAIMNGHVHSRASFSPNSAVFGNAFTQDDLKKIQNDVRQKRKTNNKNAKQLEAQKIVRIKLEAQKERILKELKREMDSFDSDLENMVVERKRIEGDMKMAQMRVLEIFRELIEFQIYEEEDLQLIKEYNEKQEFLKEWNEKRASNLFHTGELNVKISKAQSELKSFSEVYKEKVFSSEPEKADFIYKYFTYNYRKSKNLDPSEAGMDETQAAKEYDANNIDPDRKEWILYFEQNEEWVDILKNRYEAEEGLKNLDKQKSNLEIEFQKIEEKLSAVSKAISNLKEELDRIQMMKYHRIKDLMCSFILNLDQVYVPYPIHQIDSCILFSKNQLRDLNARTIELENECHKIEQDTKQLRVSKDALIKNLNILRMCQKKSKEELDENFKLKFGEVVDLDILETLKETQRVKDLKKEFKETEAACKKRIEDSNAALLKARDQLLEYKRKNTEILKRITTLGNNQIKLNRTLDNTNKQIFKDDKEVEKENNLNNKKDLLRVIGLLNNELEELKKEILTLKTK